MANATPIKDLLSSIHIAPIRFQTPAQRQAGLMRQQVDVVRQVSEEHSTATMALTAAVGTGLAAAIGALAGPTLAPGSDRMDGAKVGAATYVGAIAILVGGGAAIKKLSSS